MNEPNNISSLEALRNEIDATDRQIVELSKAHGHFGQGGGVQKRSPASP